MVARRRRWLVGGALVAVVSAGCPAPTGDPTAAGDPRSFVDPAPTSSAAPTAPSADPSAPDGPSTPVGPSAPAEPSTPAGPAGPAAGRTAPAPEAAAAAPVGSQAFFVRLAGLAIGGDFDSWGDEEVTALLTIGGATRVAFRGTLALPDRELEVFELPDEEWLELPPALRTEVDVAVRDEDGTDSEAIAGTPAPVALEEAQFAPDDGLPSVVTLDLGTIRGTSSGFLRPTVAFTIPGASCELALARAPRRDAPDAASRAATLAAFEAARALRAPASGREAAAAAQALAACVEAARRAAPRSTHTRVRQRLPRLAVQAAATAAQAETAAAADPERVRGLVSAVAGALAVLPPEDRARYAEAVAAAEAVARPDVGVAAPTLDDLERKARAAVAACQRAGAPLELEGDAAKETHLGALAATLHAAAAGAAAAKAGVAALPEVARGLAELQAAIAAEVDR